MNMSNTTASQCSDAIIVVTYFMLFNVSRHVDNFT